MKPYIAWDPNKEHDGQTGNYVFVNPSPFFDVTRTFDPMVDTAIMHPPYPMMYRPMSLKAQEKRATTCSTWTRAVKFNGIDGEEVNLSMCFDMTHNDAVGDQ